MQIQRSCESLNVWAAHRLVGVTLGLQINGVEPEPVFLDDAVDTSITAVTGGAGRILLTAAIPHGHHEIDHQLLKEAR
ncbi:hypothetical protein D3C87_1395280 [compost metagenome]